MEQRGRHVDADDGPQAPPLEHLAWTALFLLAGVYLAPRRRTRCRCEALLWNLLERYPWLAGFS